MRSYGQESGTSPLTLESSAQPSPSVINLYAPGHSSAFSSAPAYTPESESSFYASTSTTFLPHIDQRPRLGSSTSAPGMAHALRNTTLPHPGTMAYPANPKQQQNIPPLQGMTMHGVLSYSDAPSTHIKPDITGTIDKGFFLADNDWTCYRRNYFSCICSFHLPPPTHHQATLHFMPNGSSQSYQVTGWAMSISAVVAENDAHAIELVQHTPKRDKGPMAPPDKIRLNPKTPQSAHHPLGHYAGADLGLVGSSRTYEQSLYGQPVQPHHTSFPTEHTFERIQFKQATANNGKRRAAQQYYHLVVELYADVGHQAPGNDQFFKVAHRKSAKMIVRGRSPGHYQNERRASTSSGPGSGGTGLGGYPPTGPQAFGGGYGGLGSQGLGGGFSGYDPRSTDHYRSHSEAVPMEPMLSPEDSKSIHEPEKYQYFPTTIIEPQHDPRQPIEMFHHPTSRSGDGSLRNLGSSFDLTSKLYAGPLFSDKSVSSGRFEGKTSSNGYYPTVMVSPSATGLSRSDLEGNYKQQWRTSMSPLITSSTG